MKHHALLILTTTLALASIAGADTLIATQNQSAFRIVIPQDATPTLQEAARELQQSIKLATGATLALQDDSAAPSSPYISLGQTQQAKQSGLQTASLADDGFRILTRNGNLYIAGPDTPTGQWTKDGGTSNGTANGVYSFLEEYLDVRWLMPGEIGRDVPTRARWVLPDIDKTTTPTFIFRQMPHIARFTDGEHRNSINAWGQRQRLGSSIRISYNHNWAPVVGAELYDKHPEWFALRNGQRVRPEPGTQYKLETTNPELVKYFATKAVEKIKTFDRPNTFSLSPSDGRQWSESPESLALYDPIPPGRDHPAMGSLVLKWYHDVASEVARQYPQGKVAGYIYSDYAFPPNKVEMKLPDNFTPMLCGVGTYGYQMYQPAKQAQMARVFEAWAKVAPDKWFYYDLPNQLWTQEQSNDNLQFTGNTANITPPATGLLNFIFRNLTKAKIKGGTFFGDPAWSNSALANYIIAKLLWNPHLDARDIEAEWLRRAYGEAAAKPMAAFYQKLDAVFEKYYQSTNDNLKLTNGMLQNLYAANYSELEKLLLEVKKQPMNAAQRQRFTLFENNFTVLQWRLRNAKFLPPAFTSAYQANDAQVATLIEQPFADFALFPGVVPLRSGSKNPSFSKLKIKKVETVPSLDQSASPLNLLGKHTFLLYAARNGKVRIIPKQVQHATTFAAFYIMSRKNGTVASGLATVGRPIEFDAIAGQDYYFYIAPRKNIGYQLLVENAVTTGSRLDKKSGTLSLQQKSAALYVAGDEYKIQATPSGVLIATAADLETTQQQFLNPQIINLDNQWKFLPEEASGTKVFQSSFDDSKWATLNANAHWQSQGFENYRGKAWYRKQFTLPALTAGQRAVLHLSGIDGHAVVFLNGKRLGSHRLGSDFAGWDEPFSFDVTETLQAGANTIAIQVASKSLNSASGIHRPVNLVVGQGR